MLKRLNFIKSSLEGHSPKQTTNAMRLKSMKKRDERVMEIWKKDLDRPSVGQIIEQMKRNDELNQSAIKEVDSELYLT